MTPPEVVKFNLEKGPTYLHSPLEEGRSLHANYFYIIKLKYFLNYL